MSNAVTNLIPLAAASETHIRAAGVEKIYGTGENRTYALRGGTLELARGEFVSLCGSSGSGKTTLLNILGCIDTPSTGEVSIAGRLVHEMNDNQLADFRSTQLGFVFQTFNLLPVLSALENVEYPLMKFKLSKEERKTRAREALAMVGLAKHEGHRPDQLSGGQRQRVAIARAIVHRPEFIIADEPTANLDKRTASDILDLIGDLNKRLNVTVVVATHDPFVVQRTQRSIYINDGFIATL